MAMNVEADVIIYGGAAGCFSGDTEYLTPQGWKRIDEYKSDLVSTYNPTTGELVFEKPSVYIKQPCDKLTRLKGRGIDQALSDEHNIIYFNSHDLEKPKAITLTQMIERHAKSKTKGWTGKFKTTFKYNGLGLDISEGYLRLQVAVIADGRIVKKGKDNYTQMRFSKTRKYERLIEMCKKYNLPYKDNGCKPSSRYKNGKSYEVIVWPQWSDKTFSFKYFGCSANQLEIIFNEVFHWDGTFVNNIKSTTNRFSTTSKDSADFIQFVCSSQGQNNSLVEDKRDKYEDTCYEVNTSPTGKGFRCLANKDGKAVLEEFIPIDGFKYCFTVSTGMLVTRRNNKIVITGNSGKSRLLLMRPLLHIEDPNFTGIMFRRTQEALKKGGSLWPESKKLYRPFKAHINNKDRKHTFPSGANIAFDGLIHEGDEEKNYQGSQFSFIGFDEVTHFTEEQVIYLIGRLRSDAKNNSYCMMTCNPDINSWVLQYVKPYLDEEGFPIRAMGGTIRYFISTEEGTVFGATKEQLQKSHPEHAWVEDGEGNKHDVIMSYTFIDGNIYDNPALIKNEPKYLAKLKGQSRVNQARLLHGNWYAVEEASGYFKREWVKNKKAPLGAVSCRAYDKAATEVSEVNRKPDYTASIKLSKDREGYFYIQGSFHPSFKDDDSDILGRFRKRAGSRDLLISHQAHQDGTDCKVVFAVDCGQAGKVEFFESSKKLIAEGFVVKKDPTPIQKSKLSRFTPFASAAENGMIFIDESSFPNKQTLNAFYNELEAFDGERSTASRKDDWADGIASAFNYLSRQTIIHNIPFSGGSNDYKSKILKS